VPSCPAYRLRSPRNFVPLPPTFPGFPNPNTHAHVLPIPVSALRDSVTTAWILSVFISPPSFQKKLLRTPRVPRLLSSCPAYQHSTASFNYLCAFLMFSFLHLLTLSPSLCIRNAGFRGFCNTFSLSHTCGQHFSRACFQPGLETDLHPPPLSACFFKCPTLSFFTSAFAHELSSDYCSIPSVLFRLLFHSLRPAVAKFCSCSPHFRFIFDGIS